jgi:thiol-disulfide isomerase/thioredoxin
MIKSILSIFIAIVLLSCQGKKVLNQSQFDKKAGSEILYGYTDINGLKKKPYREWFENEYNSYIPDMDALNQLSQKGFKNFQIRIVMGTWCSDSRREVPRFIKILDGINFQLNSLTIINVDTDKQAKKTIVAEMEVIRIPTFIVYINGAEKERIVESPEISLEKDLLKIISE